MDPYISWASWPIYRWLHSEPVDCLEDPLVLKLQRTDRMPFDANQAIATTLFERNQPQFHSRYPRLAVQHIRRMACAAYPLSGGFDHPSLLPQWMVLPMLRLEPMLERLGPCLPSVCLSSSNGNRSTAEFHQRMFPSIPQMVARWKKPPL